MYDWIFLWNVRQLTLAVKMSCAQIQITGGGSAPLSGVSIPGAYKGEQASHPAAVEFADEPYWQAPMQVVRIGHSTSILARH